MKKHAEFFEANGIKTLSFLFNNAHETEDFIIAGTRGWYYDEETQNTPNDTDFTKLTNRETQRLRISLDQALELKKNAPEKEILVFTHFPPCYAGKESEPIVNLLCDYGIRRTYYGHIHGSYDTPSCLDAEGIRFCITSADFLHFTPLLVAKEPVL